MSLSSDPIFGTSYLTPSDFSDAAGMFGVSVALPSTDAELQRYLSSASVWINNFTSKKFDPDVSNDEQHVWNPVNRRIFVNSPPIFSVTSYEIFTGVDIKATFDPAESLFVDSQLGSVELASLAVIGTSSLLLTGITTPTVRIVYTSFQDVPVHVKLACGYLAASMMNSSFLTANAPGGLKDIKIGSMASLSLDSKAALMGVVAPAIVESLLSAETNIGVS